MGNKEDWEELEKWNENRIQQERKKYKIDYDKNKHILIIP